jgi:2'-5' RNA ligase
MSLAVISYPELNLADYYLIQAIRARHDVENHKLIRPHFTFVFPCSGIDRDNLSNHVENSLAEVNSFPFKIGSTNVNHDISGDRWNLFMVPDEGYEKIVKIHDTLYTGVLSDRLRRDIPYIPHLTIGVFEKEEECEKVSGELNRQKIVIEGWISNIDVISIDHSRIEMIKEFKLSSALG